MATAPCATAWSMKARPSARVPGRAANRNPGATFRLSTARPRISVSSSTVGSMPLADSFINSVSRNFFCPRVGADQKLFAFIHFGSGADRRDTQQRADLLDDPAHRRGGDPAAGGIVVRIGVALRFVDHDEYRIPRIVHGKRAGEGGDARIARILATSLSAVPVL